MMDWTKCAPPDGWKERAYYVVEARFSSNNPRHRAILYTGFLNGRKGTPGGYSGVYNGSYEDGRVSVDGLYSLRVISEITDMRTS